MPRDRDDTKTRLRVALAITVPLFLIAEALYVTSGSFFPAGLVVSLVFVPTALVGIWLLMPRDDST